MPARFPPLLSPLAECALLLLLIGAVYARSLGFGFQTAWDDGDYVALLFRYGSKRMRFWYVWFWAFLFPVSNLIPMNTFYHDRYLYLPALGPLVLAGLALERMRGRPWIRPALLGGIAGLGALLAVAAHGRTAVWHDPIALWEDAAATSPQMFKARNNLAVAYFEAGRLDEAEREFRATYRLWPTPQALGSLRQVEIARCRSHTPG